MTPERLVCEVQNATYELLGAAGSDLDRVQTLLECREALLVRIAKCDPNAFTADELSILRSVVHNGEAALETLTLVRRGTTTDLSRVQHLRSAVSEPPDHTVSLTG